MKHKQITNVAIFGIVLLLSVCSLAMAQNEVKSAGVGLRGTYWNLSNGPTQIKVNNYGEESMVNVGGAGGWLYFFSRMNENLFIEFSLGAIGKVEEGRESYSEAEVDVFAITPIVLGLRYNLLPPLSQSALQPYLSFGGGPYWISNIHVVEKMFEDEVTVDSNFERGAYAGGGFNFMLSNWFGINFDVKYHFIDFNVNHEHSGYEYGLGITFMWGSYKL